MNLRRLSNSLFILLLMTALIAAGPAFAQDPIIDSAYPSSAIQDTYDLSVEIVGSNLGPGASVYFCEATATTDPDCESNAKGITVGEPKARGKTKLLVTVSISSEANPGDYDIGVVYSASRKGKGTTLFKVQEKVTGNMQFETCNYVFFGIKKGPGPCMSVDGGECELLLGNPPNIKRMMTDCTITETLVLPDGVLLTSASAQESGTDRKTLTAKDPWIGDSAVITNAGHRAQVGKIDIEIATAAASGCGGDLLSAVSFVLPGVAEGTNDGSGSYFDVDGVHVVSKGSERLCTAVELIRTEGYAGTPNDWKVRVLDSAIEANSYEDTAIWLDGFKQQQDINPPTVSGNTIGRPSCSDPQNVAYGIYFGPLVARVDSSPSEALIEGNTIVMSGSNCSETTGIWLDGGSETYTMGNINSNNISGAFVGVRIDGNESTNGVNLKGNTLTPDADVDLDIGVCSDVPIVEKGKPNNISRQFEFRTVIPCP